MFTDIITAIVLGIVEGLTEFLPVSSTGHLILAGALLNFEGPRASTFEIFIQLGAILAVVILFWKRFLGLLDFKRKEGFAGLRGIGLLAVTSAPALITAAIFYDFIKENLFSPLTVAIGLGIGGIAILLIEKLLKKSTHSGLDSVTWMDALVIGLFQALSLWPGVSRAAATILSGMGRGLDRRTAAEYSFFAAVPALAAAAVYDLYKNIDVLQSSDALIFGIGFAVAFLSAWLAVKFFLKLVGTNTLIPFGWYRILVAVIVLLVLS
jgi:undecaprenyl-diphosphatase